MTKSCVTCGNVFESASNRQKYCRVCTRRGWGVCEHCGVRFAHTGNTSGRWCSRKCSYAARRDPQFADKICEQCGEVFKPNKVEQVTCSRECGNERKKMRTAANRLIKPCVVCGALFDATRHRQQQMCSIKCRGAFRALPRQECERCGKQMDTRNSTYRKQRFCSKECRRTPFGTRKPIGSSGYLAIYVGPEHPMANSRGWVQEHRYVISEKLGRPLESHEHVHHMNGRRDDNREENLELWKVKGSSKKDPPGVRASDYHCPGCRCESLERRRRRQKRLVSTHGV